MGVADFVAVNVSIRGGSQPSRQGFGTPLLAGYHTHWPERVRFYPSASALEQMVSDGFSTTEPIFRAMEVALAQDEVPPLIGIGRRANPMNQVLTLKCTETGVGVPYVVTLVGSDGVSHQHTYASVGDPNTDAAALAALMTETGVGTVTASTDTITITQVTGLLTDLQDWSSNFDVANLTDDPGIAADLVAIRAANNLSWYGLALDSNSKAEVLAAAAWVEATGIGGKFGFFDSADHDCVDGTVTTDVFSELQSLSYKKSYTQYSGRRVLSYAGFGIASLILAMDPGSYSFAFKSIAGVPADTDQTLTETQQLVLNTASTSQPGTGGKNGNWYKNVSGLNVTFPGTTPKPQWADVIIFIDWLQSNMQLDVFAVEAGLPKVPFTDFGIGLFGRAIKGRLKIGASPPFGGIDGDTIVVNVPKAADISPADKQNRNLSGLSWSATLTGGINTVEVGGTVTP